LDDKGELQFLRRSLLSGGHKFSDKFEQIAPIELFEEFKTRIQFIKELIVIGYGRCIAQLYFVNIHLLSAFL